MKTLALLAPFLLLAGCAAPNADAPTGATSQNVKPISLAQARRGFKTALTSGDEEKTPMEQAPPRVFRTVKYPSPVGDLAAYLSPNPRDGKKHPAIVWITGGDCNSIGDVWSAAPRDNDQTAAAYRKAGLIMMFPSLRGGNTNPGRKEGFLGEVNDVLAAADFLAKQTYVDAKRIYLGGHSTGGTLALLVAETSPRFRAVFSFGPVDDVSLYGADSGFVPFNLNDAQEVKLRSPGEWLEAVKSPTWIIEGEGRGNIESLQLMKNKTRNPQLHFVSVAGADHFSVLAPTNELLAKKIAADKSGAFDLSSAEANANFTR